MRIAVLLNAFPKLSETFVLNQITGLLDRGHAVDVYASAPGDSSAVHADVERYGLLDRARIGPVMPRSWLSRAVIGKLLTIRHGWRDPALIARSLDVVRRGRRAASLRLLYWTFPFLPRARYDVVHCHYGPNGERAVALRDIGAIDGKIATVFHGFDMSRAVRDGGQRLYADLFARGDLFLPISEHWRRRLIEMGCDEKKIVVHHMGIDCGRFVFAERRLESERPIRLVTVARLVEKKGVEFAIRALAKLRPPRPFIYTVVGGGPLLESLRGLAGDLGLSDRVRLEGWRSQEEVIEILREADILVAPSVTAADGDQEGIPVALMEAAAVGLPIVSTRHSGIPELVEDGVTGLLVPERDVDELAKRLGALMAEPEGWAQMGRAARARVESHFDIRGLNDRLVGLFEQMSN